MTEYLTDEWGFFIRSSRLDDGVRSPEQAIEVHETEPFGKLFRLDGHFMTSEQDEFFYHENLVHLPGITHPAPERALIVGGGDGGSAEELLKYPSMKKVTLAEIDMAVVDVSRKYLASVHKGSLDDPRLDLRIGDGFAYVRETSDTFDLIVLDLTDPGGPSLELYTPAFYRACASRLTMLGAMALHIASPIAHPDRIRQTLVSLRSMFRPAIPPAAFGALPAIAPSNDPSGASGTTPPIGTGLADTDGSFSAISLARPPWSGAYRAQLR